MRRAGVGAALLAAACVVLVSVLTVSALRAPTQNAPVDHPGAQHPAAEHTTAEHSPVLHTTAEHSPVLHARAERGERTPPRSVARLEELIEQATDAPLYRGNAVRLLLDGPETHAAMLAAIESARHHVHLETYIFADDEIGRRFADALMAAAGRGVDVRLIYDSVGSYAASEEFFERMRSGGVRAIAYNDPLADPNPRDIDTRDHRKLLIVDGRTAFTGGINIDRNYALPSLLTSEARGSPVTRGASRAAGASGTSGSGASGSAGAAAPAGWRDTHLEVAGPAVAEFQRLFVDLWEKIDGPLAKPPFAPPASELEKGHARVRVLAGVGGDDTVSQVRVAFQAAVEAGTERVWITQSYFAPDDALSESLMEAARRGVDVRILVAGYSDSKFVVNASRSFYSDLLESGVRVYESMENIMHAKTMVVDGVWSTIGSSNFDYLSFLHNHEVNAVIVDAPFAASMEDVFLADLGNAVEIELAEWRKRSLWQRTKELVSRKLRYRL